MCNVCSILYTVFFKHTVYCNYTVYCILYTENYNYSVYCILYIVYCPNFPFEAIQKCISDAPCKVRASGTGLPNQNLTKSTRQPGNKEQQADTDGGGTFIPGRQRLMGHSACRACVHPIPRSANVGRGLCAIWGSKSVCVCEKDRPLGRFLWFWLPRYDP